MEQSAELRELMMSYYDAPATGDLAVLDGFISTSDEVRGIGTDPQKWWTGGQLLEIWKEQIEAMGGSMPLAPGDPEAYAEGSIGWVADQPRLQTPDDDVPLRFTAVFRREDGDWKMVRSDGSIGVAKEASFGEDIPT